MHLTNIEQFKANPIPIRRSALMSHRVTKGTIHGSTKSWICKSMETAEEHAQRSAKMQKDKAQRELLAQEFFRLIIPHQPETRVAQHAKTQHYFILSEEAQGYRKLPKNEPNHFEDGTYTGLGQALVCAMFVEEVDLKNGNIGLDYQNRVIKIDGDLSFSSRAPGRVERYHMADGLISALPYPKHFYTFNWLDYVKKRVCNPASRIVHSTLKVSPQFRQEINQAILKILLLPDHVIEGFVNASVPERRLEFVSLIQSRRDRLQIIATQNPSFQRYLSTIHAQNDAQDLTEHLVHFKVQGQIPILQHTAMGIDLACDITGRAIDIRSHLPLENINAAHALTLLKEINQHQIPWGDPQLSEFIYTSMNEICNNGISETESSSMHARLTAMLALIDSPEITDVNQTIVQLASKPATLDKANNIAAAFRSLPLNERCVVISTFDANPVQQELARHRFFPHTGNIYLKENKIDTERAANAFKSLKTKYTEDMTLLR